MEFIAIYWEKPTNPLILPAPNSPPTRIDPLAGGLLLDRCHHPLSRIGETIDEQRGWPSEVASQSTDG